MNFLPYLSNQKNRCLNQNIRFTQCILKGLGFITDEETGPTFVSDKTDTENWTWARVLASVGAILTIIFALLFLRENGLTPLNWVYAGFVFLPLSFGAMCLWFSLKGHLSYARAHMTYTLLGGIIWGAMAFLGGFIGPLIFAPEANQGPLLGIFITGPIGFVIGLGIGIIYGFIRLRKQRQRYKS